MRIEKRFFENACQELLKTIKEYESDTFSSEYVNLTENECYEIAGRAIHYFIDNRLDGIWLSEWLDQIRDS